MRRRLGSLSWAGLAILMSVGGCGGSTQRSRPAAPPSAAPLSAPPVVVDAPALRMPPAGRVIELDRGQKPEGIAVAPGGTGVGGTPVGGTVVVAAREKLLLERAATTLRPGRALTLPGSGRHVRITAAGMALMAAEDTGQLVVADLTSGRVTAVAVGRAPHDAATLPGDRALVSDEATGEVSIVAGLGAVGGPREVQRLPAGLQPGGVASEGNLACAVDVRGRYLYVYDVTAGRPVRSAGRVLVGAGPTHAKALGGGLVAVADAFGKAVEVVSLPQAKVLSRRMFTQAPEGLAADPARHRLWVTTPGDNQLHELRIDGSQLVPGRSFPTVRQPNSDAVDARTGVVYVAGATGRGTVQALTPPA